MFRIFYFKYFLYQRITLNLNQKHIILSLEKHFHISIINVYLKVTQFPIKYVLLVRKCIVKNYRVPRVDAAKDKQTIARLPICKRYC